MYWLELAFLYLSACVFVPFNFSIKANTFCRSDYLSLRNINVKKNIRVHNNFTNFHINCFIWAYTHMYDSIWWSRIWMLAWSLNPLLFYSTQQLYCIRYPVTNSMLLFLNAQRVKGNGNFQHLNKFCTHASCHLCERQ